MLYQWLSALLGLDAVALYRRSVSTHSLSHVAPITRSEVLFMDQVQTTIKSLPSKTKACKHRLANGIFQQSCDVPARF